MLACTAFALTPEAIKLCICLALFLVETVPEQEVCLRNL